MNNFHNLCIYLEFFFKTFVLLWKRSSASMSKEIRKYFAILSSYGDDILLAGNNYGPLQVTKVGCPPFFK